MLPYPLKKPVRDFNRKLFGSLRVLTQNIDGVSVIFSLLFIAFIVFMILLFRGLIIDNDRNDAVCHKAYGDRYGYTSSDVKKTDTGNSIYVCQNKDNKTEKPVPDK